MSDIPEQKIITLNHVNIDQYDIFCYKTRKGKETYQRKVNWLLKQFTNGLVFKLLLVKEKKEFKSKGFIEYIPGERCWRGIKAPGYMVIHCLWVDQKQQGKGYGSTLVQECLDDAKAMNGVTVVTSCDPWLPSSKIFEKKGFVVAGNYPPRLVLMVKKNKPNAQDPAFIPINKDLIKGNLGLRVYMSGQCPYTYSRVRNWEKKAFDKGIPIELIEVKTPEETKHGLHPYGTLCAFFHDEFLLYSPMATDITKKIRKKK